MSLPGLNLDTNNQEGKFGETTYLDDSEESAQRPGRERLARKKNSSDLT